MDSKVYFVVSSVSLMIWSILSSTVFGGYVSCSPDVWSEIKGDWNAGEEGPCTFNIEDEEWGNVIWLGSNDGSTPDADYEFEAFSFEVSLLMSSGSPSSANSGLLFRAQTTSAINDYGQQFYFGVKCNTGQALYGVMDDGWTQLDQTTVDATCDTTIVIRVEAVSYDVYNFYVDDVIVFFGVSLGGFGYNAGSFGLRTFRQQTLYNYAYISSDLPDSSFVSCLPELWSEIKGDWNIGAGGSCTFEITDDAWGNVIWLGSEDGLVADADFSYGMFTFTTSLKMYSGSVNGANSGVLFRAQTVSDINDYGQQYYFGVKCNIGRAEYGRMDDGWTQLGEVSVGGVSCNKNIVLTVEAVSSNSFNLIVDGNVVFSVVTLDDFDGLGSFGLRTFRQPTFYNYAYIRSDEPRTCADQGKECNWCKEGVGCMKCRPFYTRTMSDVDGLYECVRNDDPSVLEIDYAMGEGCETDNCLGEDNPNCEIQKSWGCKKCYDQFFRKNNDFLCVPCSLIPNCYHCNTNDVEWGGCDICDAGYSLAWDFYFGYRRCVPN